MNKKPTIHILGTGGTIAGAGKTHFGSVYQPGKMDINDILQYIPEINDIAEVTGEQIVNIGSQNMTETIWIELTRIIHRLFSSSNIDGIVITHGTDTLEETAYFLNLVIPFAKPVILTGAMRPATAYSADGPVNLLSAVIIASNEQSAHKGVLVTTNEKIFSAHDVSKVATTHIDAFTAPNYGPLGHISGTHVEFYRVTEKKHTINSVFAKNIPQSLPKVAVLYGHTGADVTLIDACIEAQVAGIVFAGTGNGNMPEAYWQKIAKVREKNIHVVRASRTGHGNVTTGETNDEALGTIASGILNPQKAKILLQLALTITDDLARIREFFAQY